MRKIDPLSENVVSQYHRDGFLLGSGLITESVARRAEATMWEVMGMDRDDPASWAKENEDAVSSTIQAGFKPQESQFQYFGNQVRW